MLVGCFMVAYLVVGVIVVAYILLFRPPMWSRQQGSRMLWETRYHKRNTTWWLLDLSTSHPVGIVLNVIFWPAWLVADEDAREDERDGEPEYHGPTTLDDDAKGGGEV